MRTKGNPKFAEADRAGRTSQLIAASLPGLARRFGLGGLAALSVLLGVFSQVISPTPGLPQGHHFQRATDSSSDDDLQELKKSRQERRAEHARLKDERLGLRAFRDMSYVPGSDNDSQKLDLCLPEESAAAASGKNVRATKPYPVVVFIHGGGWRNGSRRNRVFYPLVPRGYAVASISYRLTKEAT